MHVLVLGAAGMLGRKLTQAISERRQISGVPVSKLTLVDVVSVDEPTFIGTVEVKVADLTKPNAARELLADRPQVIFHLAAIVSGEAEASFEKGYSVNLDGTRNLFEAIRQHSPEGYCPKIVFASSIVVFGAPLPDVISDDQVLTPQNSYGTQKAIGELLLADYSRRGFLDGIGIRLPTIAIRPGKPNQAASGFFSSILREPLIGLEARLPVAEGVRHWFASPRAAIGFLLHAAELDTTSIEGGRSLTMPGVDATVGDEIAALRRIAGDKAVALIRREFDPDIALMIAGWPRAFTPKRALALGFKAESSIDDIIIAHIEDELGGKLPF